MTEKIRRSYRGLLDTLSDLEVFLGSFQEVLTSWD
jgi:hypothetical protein